MFYLYGRDHLNPLENGWSVSGWIASETLSDVLPAIPRDSGEMNGAAWL